MKFRILAVPAAVLATATAVAVLVAQVGNKSPTLDPGFVPSTGQINPGHAPEPWSAAPPQEPQPSQKQARAALMMPDDGAPSVGPATGSTATSTTTGESAGPIGPIGATTQTMPAKFSPRNDLLDRVGTTAWPLPLNEQQRRQILDAVMADHSPPAAGAASLKPGDALSFDQTRDMHHFPQALAGIDGLQGLQFVKGKDKVLLVRPPNGIVVDQIGR